VSRAARLRTFAAHPIAQNAMALSGGQLATYVIPLLTFPYQARVLDPAGFGQATFAVSFAFALFIVVEWGFNLSGSRRIAQERDDPVAMGRTVADLTAARLVLAVVVTAIAVLAGLLVPEFRDAPEFLVFAWLDALALGFAPAYVFAGQERGKRLAATQTVQKLGWAVLLVVLVREPDDAWKVVALLALTDALGAASLWARVAREMPLARPSLRRGMVALREAASLFLVNVATTLRGNPFILGLATSTVQVAFYGAAERLGRAALRGLQPIAIAIFPRITYLVAQDEGDRARRLAGQAMLAQLALAFAAAAVLFAGAPLVVGVLLGPGYEPVVPVLRIFACILPFAAMTNVLGLQWMIPHGMDRQFTTIVIGGALLDVALAIPLGIALGARGTAIAFLVGEIVSVAAMVAVLSRRSMLPRPPALRRRAAVGNP
jgi:PST family polysaccharide transporter